MRISERYVPVDFIESKDYGSAGITSDAVNMGKVHSLSVLISFGAITGNSILTVYASAARDLTTTAIAFNYRLGAAVFKAALADQLGDAVAVASTGLTLTAATFKNRQMVIEIDADTMPEGKPWLTIGIDATATVLNVAALGVGLARYPGI
jgi:hypothetical protein